MTNSKPVGYLSTFLMLASFGAQGLAEQTGKDPLWLSDKPPTMELMKQFSRAHGGMVIRDKEGNYSKMLWLRSGTDLKDAPYLTNKAGQFYLTDEQSSNIQLVPSKADPEHTAIKFKMPNEGYYDAYYVEQEVRDGVRYVDVAKSEVLKHNCRLGHNFDVEQHRPQSNKEVPLEILRLRFDDETYHTRFNSGKNVLFKVLYKGDPAAGADVTISTEEGWTRKSKTDSEGIVSFQVIQDRFNENKDKPVEKRKNIQNQDGKGQYRQTEKKVHKQMAEQSGRHGRRRSEAFLVTVQYSDPVAGEYAGSTYKRTLYTTTFPGYFSPPENAYKSYAYGLVFGSAGFLVLGIGSYLYRRRRIKPFKEVNLDE